MANKMPTKSWTYRTDSMSTSKRYATPQAALDAAVAGGNWPRNQATAAKVRADGGWIEIVDASGHAFLDADELELMLAAVK